MMAFLRAILGLGGHASREAAGDADVPAPPSPDVHPPPATHDASAAMRQQEQWLDHVAATDAAHQAIADAAHARHEP